MSRSDPNDPFDRVNYRGLIAWPARIEREWPFLEWVLAAAPERSVLDLGCGTGEHVRFLASRGYRAVGIDRSAAQIEKARDYEGEYGEWGPRFLEADILDLPRLVPDRFGAALCLGNVLPHMDDEDLEQRLRAIARVLLPGGRLMVQILNYAPIVEGRVRHLPLNFRPDPELESGEIVWVRLIRPADAGHAMFYPVTLRIRPGQEPPVEIQAAREVRLRAWTWPELESLLQKCGFVELQAFGDMQRAPYESVTAHDLIVVAKHEAENGAQC
jgi:SAM-dependent methyltransferase